MASIACIYTALQELPQKQLQERISSCTFCLAAEHLQEIIHLQDSTLCPTNTPLKPRGEYHPSTQYALHHSMCNHQNIQNLLAMEED